MTIENKTVLVIGGGVSGLIAAWKLAQNRVPFQLWEARDRLGGRILGAETPSGEERFDMGPAWFWSPQERILATIAELGLQSKVFEQYARGAGLIEYESGEVRKVDAFGSMAGSLRLIGGLTTLIEALTQEILSLAGNSSIAMNTKLDEIILTGKSALCKGGSGGRRTELEAGHVVLALPPRIVASSISFNPVLTHSQIEQCLVVPTWMAGQAKVVALYPSPFWRGSGLSGDAFSQRGPLTEIHDASSVNGSVGALFGFVGISPEQRLDSEKIIKQEAVAQLVRLFGEKAAAPSFVFYYDWAADNLTATSADQGASAHHDRETGLVQWFDDRLIWAGAETAAVSSHAHGYLEGAFESAFRAVSCAGVNICSDDNLN